MLTTSRYASTILHAAIETLGYWVRPWDKGQKQKAVKDADKKKKKKDKQEKAPASDPLKR